MVAALGIPAWHSKGMLLTLHDTSACRENTGRTSMHRLNDEGMQKCMDGLAADESSKWLASQSSGQKLDRKKDEHRNSGIMFWLLQNSSLEMCIICKYTTSAVPKVSKETVLGLLLERLCWMMLCMKRFPEWGRISWSLHQLVMSVQLLKIQITVPPEHLCF